MACTATSAVIDLAAATAKVDDGSCNAESVQMSDLGAKQTGSEDTQNGSDEDSLAPMRQQDPSNHQTKTDKTEKCTASEAGSIAAASKASRPKSLFASVRRKSRINREKTAKKSSSPTGSSMPANLFPCPKAFDLGSPEDLTAASMGIVSSLHHSASVRRARMASRRTKTVGGYQPTSAGISRDTWSSQINRSTRSLTNRPQSAQLQSGLISSNGSSTAYVRSSGGLGLDGGEQRVVSGGGLLLHHESTGLLNGSTGSTGGPAGLLTNGCNSLNVSPGGILARSPMGYRTSLSASSAGLNRQYSLPSPAAAKVAGNQLRQHLRQQDSLNAIDVVCTCCSPYSPSKGCNNCKLSPNNRSPVLSRSVGGSSAFPASIREDPEGGSMNGCDDDVDDVVGGGVPVGGMAVLLSGGPGGGAAVAYRRNARPPRLKRQVTIMEDSVSIPDLQRDWRCSSTKSLHNSSVKRQSTIGSVGMSIGSMSSLAPPQQSAASAATNTTTHDLTSNRKMSARHKGLSPQMSVSSRRSLPMTRHLSVKSADRISVQGGIGVVPTPDHQINVMSKVPHSLIEDSSFTQDEIYSLREAFAQLDIDGDGKLSRKEIETAMGNMLSESDLDALLADLDTDQSGQVEWTEFFEAMKIRMREPESVKMLKEAYRVMAADTSEGVLTATEIRRFLLQQCSTPEDVSDPSESPEAVAGHPNTDAPSRAAEKMKESELEEMLSALDLDGDGKVKMEDFLRLLVIPNNDNGSQTSESAEDQDKSLKRQYCIIL